MTSSVGCVWLTRAVHDRHLQTLVHGPRRARGVEPAAQGTPIAMRSGGHQSDAMLVGGLRSGAAAAAEQVAVVVTAELATEEVQRQRVDARVDVRQTVGDDLEHVPEHVVLRRVEVEPEVEDVTRQPADDEDHDERQHETSHFLAGLHLPRAVYINNEYILYETRIEALGERKPPLKSKKGEVCHTPTGV